MSRRWWPGQRPQAGEAAADHDGIYCEDLPCPCLKPGSGTQSPPSSNPPSGSGPALFKGRCKRGRLPDYRCTPGAVFRNVTADDLCAQATAHLLHRPATDDIALIALRRAPVPGR